MVPNPWDDVIAPDVPVGAPVSVVAVPPDFGPDDLRRTGRAGGWTPPPWEFDVLLCPPSLLGPC